MKHRIFSLRAVALACLAAATLAACGGGGNEGDGLTDAQREDRAASASAAGLLSFASSQIARTDDAAEPRSISGITPPTDETSEPLTR